MFDDHQRDNLKISWKKAVSFCLTKCGAQECELQKKTELIAHGKPVAF